jgi:hypothetical protein
MSTKTRTFLGFLIASSLLLSLNGIALAQGDEGAATIAGVPVCCCGAILLLRLIIAVWVVRDAQVRGTSAGAWLLIVLIFDLLGLLAYLIARPQGKLVPCPNCGRKKPIRDQVCPHCGAKVV